MTHALTSPSPADFQPPTEEAPFVLLPVTRSLFADRAARFAHLARDHSLGDWLDFLGQLSAAQQHALDTLPAEAWTLPAAASLALAREHGMPPLNASALIRPPVWRDGLRALIDDIRPAAPPAARAILDSLAQTPDPELEALADRLLDNRPSDTDGPALPFVGAALQIMFTALASQLDGASLSRLDPPGLCPCCGSLPVSSLVRLSPTVNNLRYAHCSLCNTQWNLPRATCTACGHDQHVALHEIDGSNGAVRAETCDDCKGYLKLLTQEKDPNLDPIADDLATLALDLLVDEAGYGRCGPNLFLLGAS